MNKKWILIILTILTHFSAQSLWGTNNICFTNEIKLPTFLQAIANTDIEPEAALTSTYFACAELQKIETAAPGAEQEHALFAQRNWDFPVLGGLAVRLSEIFSGVDFLKIEDVQKNFGDRLLEIKQIQNRFERIRQTYMLVNQYQGKYDRLSPTPIFSINPRDTLERSARTSIGGVCRQFAELLKWSLNEVGSFNQENVELSFKAEIATSWNHMWVRVNLPTLVGGRIEIRTLDLDNTDHPKLYVPLRSRIAISEGRRALLYQQCKRVISCLVANNKNPALDIDESN